MTDDIDFDDIAPPDLRSAHVIVVGNEKGGTGKSTLSIHLSVALLKAGFRVATIDLDTRQQTLTRFFENRASWAKSAPWDVELPYHFAPERGTSDNVRDNETREFAAFAEAIGEVEHAYEFVVIDTPASDSYLMRLAHSLADTLVSPVNDSYIDVDVFSRVHHDRNKRGTVAQYADLVIEARRKRHQVDQGIIDWVLVRNRIASLQSNNAKQIAVSIGRMAGELKFRPAEGLHDRVIFRELFPIGLTALDPIEEAMRTGTLSTSQQSARREIEEELGLVVPAGRLLLTDWLPPWSGWDDALCLVFDGGTLPGDTVTRIVKQEREIRDAQFLTPELVRARATDFTARRVEAALEGDRGYTESGR